MFRDCPEKVCEAEIDLNRPELSLESEIKQTVQKIMNGSNEAEALRWATLPHDSMMVTKITGGITNILYLVSEVESNRKVVVRIYGAGTASFIDRTTENFVFARLSTLGIGPIFYGRFLNGRVEGYLPAVSLESAEMRLPHIYPHIAQAVAQMHQLHFPEISGSGWLWTKIRSFLSLAKDSPLAAVMTEELSWLEQYVLARRSDSTEGADPVNQERAQGRAFGLQEVMCHNDLLSGNILLRTAKSSANSDTGGADDSAGDEGGRGDKGSEKRVFLIDYEYAAYNFRAFDLANHFSEHCGFEYDYSRTLPSQDFMLQFLRVYCAAVLPPNSEPTEAFLLGFLDSIRWLLLASHLFWGSWALVQAQLSSIDFDYAGYAQRRQAAFLDHSRAYHTVTGSVNC